MSVCQECPASVSDQTVQKAVSFESVRKSVKQECPTRMSHKGVLQGCPIQEFSNVGAFGFVGSIRFLFLWGSKVSMDFEDFLLTNTTPERSLL